MNPTGFGSGQPRGCSTNDGETLNDLGVSSPLDRYDEAMMTVSDNSATSALIDDPGIGLAHDATNLNEKLILEWVNRADLMRVRGIGEEYSDLLESAGVDTVKELRRRNPANLLASMVKVNNNKRLVRRLPTETMVERWVEHAGELDTIVTH